MKKEFGARTAEAERLKSNLKIAGTSMPAMMFVSCVVIAPETVSYALLHS